MPKELQSSRMDHWMHILKMQGYRVTAPRQVIVDIMVDSDRALSPVEVYDLGREEYPRLGLVTVYRTLEKLSELGLIERVHQPDDCHRYLRATQGHQHLLICSSCGRVVYFSGDDLDFLFNRVAQDTGFEIDEHWLQLFGTCPACLNNN